MIGQAPDPVADEAALTALKLGSSPELDQLVEELFLHPEWRRARLGALFPGLALLGSPRPRDLLRMRAANALGRAEVVDWRELASTSPEGLVALPAVGPVTGREIATASARAWAAAYLFGPELASNAAPADDGRDLGRAFEELEATPGFGLFRKRRLDPEPSSQAMLAAELGVAKQRVSQRLLAVERHLSRQMQDDDWPIGVAAAELGDRLGAVARPSDLQAACAAIDPDGRDLPTSLPHRRALLLRLRGYRTGEKWILDPGIEGLTRTILSALAGSDSADLETVGRHLSRAGVRAEVQLTWIIDQADFRVIDGAVQMDVHHSPPRVAHRHPAA